VGKCHAMNLRPGAVVSLWSPSGKQSPAIVLGIIRQPLGWPVLRLVTVQVAEGGQRAEPLTLSHVRHVDDAPPTDGVGWDWGKADQLAVLSTPTEESHGTV
jgi:hypothetical protein